MSSDDTILLDMSKAKTVEAVWDIHTRAMADLGFNRLVYGFSRSPVNIEAGIGDVRDGLVLSNHSPQYMEHFIGNKMYFNGPMTKWAAENEGSCSWGLIQQMATERQFTASEMAVIQINQEHGVTAGYTISFHSKSDTTKAAIGLAAQEGFTQDQVDDLWAAHHDFIELCNNMMHLKMSNLPHTEGIIKRLSARQQEVLQWAAQGKTADDMAIILDLNRATVEKHLRLARETLNTSTTAHAVMRASAANLFLKLKP